MSDIANEHYIKWITDTDPGSGEELDRQPTSDEGAPVSRHQDPQKLSHDDITSEPCPEHPSHILMDTETNRNDLMKHGERRNTEPLSSTPIPSSKGQGHPMLDLSPVGPFTAPSLRSSTSAGDTSRDLTFTSGSFSLKENASLASNDKDYNPKKNTDITTGAVDKVESVTPLEEIMGTDVSEDADSLRLISSTSSTVELFTAKTISDASVDGLPPREASFLTAVVHEQPQSAPESPIADAVSKIPAMESNSNEPSSLLCLFCSHGSMSSTGVRNCHCRNISGLTDLLGDIAQIPLSPPSAPSSKEENSGITTPVCFACGHGSLVPGASYSQCNCLDGLSSLIVELGNLTFSPRSSLTKKDDAKDMGMPSSSSVSGYSRSKNGKRKAASRLPHPTSSKSSRTKEPAPKPVGYPKNAATEGQVNKKRPMTTSTFSSSIRFSSSSLETEKTRLDSFKVPQSSSRKRSSTMPLDGGSPSKRPFSSTPIASTSGRRRPSIGLSSIDTSASPLPSSPDTSNFTIPSSSNESDVQKSRAPSRILPLSPVPLRPLAPPQPVPRPQPMAPLPAPTRAPVVPALLPMAPSANPAIPPPPVVVRHRHPVNRPQMAPRPVPLQPLPVPRAAAPAAAAPQLLRNLKSEIDTSLLYIDLSFYLISGPRCARESNILDYVCQLKRHRTTLKRHLKELEDIRNNRGTKTLPMIEASYKKVDKKLTVIFAAVDRSLD